MADAYRGLTLRIGADARPLQSAINSITRSAHQAQSMFNKMNKALKFDSSNVNAMRARLELTSDRATHMARAVREIGTAMDQAAMKTVEFSERSGIASGSIEKVASSTRDVYAQTQKLRSEQVHVNAELQRIYDETKKIANTKIHGVFKSAEDRLKNADEYVKQLVRDMDALGEKGDAAADEMKNLVREAVLAKDSNLAEAFGFEKTEEGAEKVYHALRNLHRASGEVSSDLKAMNKVEGFKAMQYDTIAFKAELRQAISEMTRFKAELYAMGNSEGLAKAAAEAKSLDNAMEQALNEARVMREAYYALPASMETVRAKATSLRTAQDTLNHKIEATTAVLRKIENTPGFDRLAASTGNVYVAFEKASQAVTEAGVDLKIAEQRAAGFERELEEISNDDFIGPRRDFEAMGRSVEDVKADLSKANAELDEFREKAAAADKALESAAINKTWREGNNEIAKAKTGVARLAAEASKLKAVQRAGVSIREFGYGLYSTVTPAIMMAGMYGIQAANDIDSAWRDMRKTVNGSEEDFDHLKDAALEFSSTHVTSADTILEIEAMGGQLGIAVENLEAFSEVVSNLDIATDINAEDMAKYIGQLSNIMDDIDTSNVAQYQKDITSFSDSLVRLGNNSAAQESSIMKVMMRIASIGNISGMTTPQLLAISTAVAATGQGCEAAGTAISKTFSNIETAVGAGGEKLQGFADVADMSAQDFADAWKNDPMTAFTAFINGLKRIDEEGGSVDNTLASLKINSVRQKQALMGLTNTIDVMNQSLEMSQDAWSGEGTMINGKMEEAGDAAREAQRKSEGFSGELKMMQNNAKLLASELADGATPIIKALGAVFKDFAASVKGMPSEMKTFTVGLLGAVAAIGPLTVGLGTILAAGSKVVSAFGSFGKAAMKASDHIASFSDKVAALPAKTATGQKGLSVLSKSIRALSSAGGMIAIAGVAVALDLVVSSIQETIKWQEDYKKATDGLKDATEQTSPSVRELSEQMDVTGTSAGQAATNFKELIENQAKLGETISQRNKDGQAQIDQLQRARNTIDLLMNKTNEQGEATKLTAEEQGRLRAAISLVNSECGTQYQVVDALNGKIADEKGVLMDTCGALDDYISKKQEAIKKDVLEQNYADTYKQYLEDMKAYAQAKSQYDSDLETLGNAKDSASVAYMSEQKLKLDELKASLDATSGSLQFIEGQMGAAEEATDSATKSFANLVLSSPEWRNAFNDDELFGNFAQQLQTVGVSVDEFSKLTYEDMFTAKDAFVSSGQDITAALSAIGIESKSLGDKFSEGMNSIGVDFQSMASQLGTNTQDLAMTFDGAGWSMKKFSDIGSSEINRMVSESDGQLSNFMAMLQQLDEQQAKPTVTVNTDQADEAVGEAQEQLDEYDGGEYSAEIGAEDNATETLQLTQEQLEQISASGVTVPIEADNSSAMGSLNEIQSFAFDSKAVEITDNSGDVMGEFDTLNRYSFSSKSIDVRVVGGALLALSSIQTALKNMTTYKEIKIRTIEEKVTHATGGISPAPIYPRHAAGAINGIVTRATMTNIGWVGEDGAEALFHMGHAGGAVVPLTNRRYVRPFARAVASEMGGGGARNVTVNVSLGGYTHNETADQLVRDIASGLENILNTEA